MPLDLNNARQRLHEFDFVRLFTEELGWSQPSSCLAHPLHLQGGILHPAGGRGTGGRGCV